MRGPGGKAEEEEYSPYRSAGGNGRAKFITKLLQEVLRLEEIPRLDRTHRSLRARPKDGEPPRPIGIYVHYFQTRNQILRKAGETSPLTYQGKRIFVFTEYTSSIAKRRAEFGTVKQELHSVRGVKFGLYYPTVLRITLPNVSSHRFQDPTLSTRN